MDLTRLDRIFWLAGLVGHVALLAVLTYRRLGKVFPVFTTLIAFNVVRTGALFYLHGLGSATYFYSYWSLCVVDALLQFLILAEVTKKIFRPKGRCSEDVRTPLLMLASGSIVCAVVITALASPPIVRDIQNVMFRADLFITLLMSELFAGILVISAMSGFAWRSRSSVIVRGLGIYSTFSLLTKALEAFYGVSRGGVPLKALTQLQIFMYLLCLGYWIVGLWKEEAITVPLPASVELQLSKLNHYASAALAGVRVGRKIS